MTSSLARKPRPGRFEPFLNGAVVALLVGPWIVALSWSFIDSLLDRF